MTNKKLSKKTQKGALMIEFAILLAFACVFALFNHFDDGVKNVADKEVAVINNDAYTYGGNKGTPKPPDNPDVPEKQPWTPPTVDEDEKENEFIGNQGNVVGDDANERESSRLLEAENKSLHSVKKGIFTRYDDYDYLWSTKKREQVDPGFFSDLIGFFTNRHYYSLNSLVELQPGDRLRINILPREENYSETKYKLYLKNLASQLVMYNSRGSVIEYYNWFYLSNGSMYPPETSEEQNYVKQATFIGVNFRMKEDSNVDDLKTFIAKYVQIEIISQSSTN